MAKVAKKKKKKLGGRTSGSTTSGKKVTPLRPFRNPQTAPCIPGCPIGNDARGAVAIIGSAERCDRPYDEAFEQGFRNFARTNPFPAITGRLCTACCELECNRQHKDGSVYINKVERFVGDFAVQKKLAFEKPEAKQDGKVAVVGAGPTGLTCAYHLALKGWQVTVIDANDRPGGFLRYVPAFRLPREVLDQEIQRILDLGVELRPKTRVGKDVSLEELQKEFKAVFVAVGAHGDRIKVRGPWEADNSMTGIDYFAKVNAGEKIDLGGDVVVLGGGDQALDVARSARRMGAKATVLYRRTREDMPALAFDVAQAEAEGISFEFLAGPAEMVKEGHKGLKLVCQRLKLGPKEAAGRQRPVPTGETFEVPFSTLVQGQIQEPDYADPMGRIGLDRGRRPLDGKVKIDEPGIFGGGDANKLGHVTVAIAKGLRAAEEIDAQLRGEEYAPPERPPLIFHDKIKMDWYEAGERRPLGAIPVEDRTGDAEVCTGFSQDDVIAEAKRCFSCGMCMDCDNCWMYCQDQAVDKLAKNLPVGEHYGYKHDLCTGCEKCAEECPCNYLKMQ
jgi:NADPH-dependent glutamate synthase beta subunit-like oxidoreductase/Pyruvate/2-oxoacid:ferredoxin oxidoreductase delta subunit